MCLINGYDLRGNRFVFFEPVPGGHGGRPSCPVCGRLLQFGTDRQGRTTESCDCGYRGFVRKRLTDPEGEQAQ